MGKYSLRNAGKQHLKLTEQSFKRFKLSPKYWDASVKGLGNILSNEDAQLLTRFEKDQHGIYDDGAIITLLGDDIDTKESIVSLTLRGMAGRMYICQRFDYEDIVNAELSPNRSEDGTAESKICKDVIHNDFIVIDFAHSDLTKKTIAYLDKILNDRYKFQMPIVLNFDIMNFGDPEYTHFTKSSACRIISKKGVVMQFES